MIASRGSSPWFASIGSANSATLETQHVVDASTTYYAFSLRHRSESSRPLKRIVLVLVLSAAVIVIVIDIAHHFSAFDSATPSIDDRRQITDRRMIASSSGLVPITSTSTVASRLSTSTTRDRQNGNDQRMTEYQTAHRRRLTLIADQRISMVDHQLSLAVSLVNQTP